MRNTTAKMHRELATEIAVYFYDIDLKSIKQLAGEVDLNFLIVDSTLKKYLLKIAASDQDLDQLEFQSDLIQHLEKKEANFLLPKIFLNKSGKPISVVKTNDGKKRYARLISWVDGEMYANVRPHTPQLLTRVGKTAGQLHQLLSDFDHPKGHRKYKWNVSEVLWTKEHLDLFEGKQKEIATTFIQQFEKEVVPILPNLRKGIAHNDINDYNVVVKLNGDQIDINGFIDFGDAMYTERINELAITAAYALMGHEQPLDAAYDLVKGFHASFPLEENELSVLYTLVAARLLISVTSSAINKKAFSENEYLLISEKSAWELLEKWINIDPALAHYTFRSACNLEPCPKYHLFRNWSVQNPPSNLTTTDVTNPELHHFDLTTGSAELGNMDLINDARLLNHKMDEIIQNSGHRAAIGKYKETRIFYTPDGFKVKGNQGNEWRTIHVGLDIFEKAKTPIFAPWDGVVHAVANNTAPRDYGPTLILKHQIDEATSFYTLYGHLNWSSIKDWQPGLQVMKGQEIAKMGYFEENGNWNPHLHFQIVLDLLNYEGDFPGVARPRDIEVWESLSPNPFPLFKIPEKTSTQLSSDTILEKRKKLLGRSLSLSYKRPHHMVRGHMQYLYDQTGRKYLDTVNNVPHVGHQNPQVVKAATRQLQVLNTNTRYLHENLVSYAEALTATLPRELNVVHFVNSGSEANELAMRMADIWSGQHQYIISEASYHGNTAACVAISSYKFDGKGGMGCLPHIHKVPAPDTYRGIYKDENAGKKYADHIEEVILKMKKNGVAPSAFIVESILSCGGQVVPPPNYFKHAFEHVRTAGGLAIADEVQVGMGRVGKHFWGFELQGVVPDIVTMGKPIGNGHPLGAVVTTEEVAAKFANGMEYFNTFGGNPVSCAIGMEVLNVVKQQGLQAKAEALGIHLKSRLRELQEMFPIIGDVRGEGLFLGFEMVRDPKTLEPADKETTYLANRMSERGFLMSTDGPLHNVIKIKPPMVFTMDNANELLENLQVVLNEHYLKL